MKGSGAELSRRVQNLLTVSRVQANANGSVGSVYLPGSTKIHDQSLTDMQEVRYGKFLCYAVILSSAKLATFPPYENMASTLYLI